MPAPERGRIGIFNRSYYEEVLVVRVHPEILRSQGLPDELLDEKTIWKERYRSIVDLEEHLHRNGTRIIKVFLHLSKDEQRKRFLERIDEPDKNWKFSLADIHERKYWKRGQYERLAGSTPSKVLNVPRLITAYYTEVPDPSVPEQRVAFGTSGHRGSAFEKAFNEWHILAISQAICLYRKQKQIDGPLFLGMDTHALSVPALASALEVLAANGVDVMLAERDEYTPDTPVISHAILTYNRGRKTGLADGIVITPSHNPPHDGGFKYNPPNGGRRNPPSPPGSRRRQTSFSRMAFWV